jgi:hypothetical protein
VSNRSNHHTGINTATAQNASEFRNWIPWAAQQPSASNYPD